MSNKQIKNTYNTLLPYKRFCDDCGIKIVNCMGMVNAGDFISKKKHIRELCGKCVLIRDKNAGLLDL
jgi:hypothetical protein